MFIGPSCSQTETKVLAGAAPHLIFPLIEPWLPPALDRMLKEHQPTPRQWDLLDWPRMLRLALLQAINPRASFEEMLREVWQTWWQADCVATPPPSTPALAKARRRLPNWALRDLLRHSAQAAQAARPLPAWPDHRLLTIDGTPLSLQNSPSNRAHFGTTRHQNGEAYFPQALAVWVASLHPQVVLEEYFGTSHEGDETVAPQILARVLQPNDLVLGDGHYGYFPTLYTVAQHQAFYLVRAPGPLQPQQHVLRRVTERDWDLRLEQSYYMHKKYAELSLPQHLDVRGLLYTIPARDALNGVEEACFLTNLPRERFPYEHLAQLPPLRWNHETLNNDIKSRLGLEELRSLTPAGAYAEVLAHLVMANFIHALLWQVFPERLCQGSFTVGLDALRQANQQLRMAPERRTKIVETMRQMILARPVVSRPGRSEPRMTRPRRRPYQIFKEPRAAWREQRKVG